MEQDQKFLEYVVKSLVDKPDEVKIERSIDELGVLLRLTVSPDDMGKIIGRNGATAKAIRTMLRVVGMKSDARVNLKIEEPAGSERSMRTHISAHQEDTDDRGTIEDMPKDHVAHVRQERTLDDVLSSLKD